MNLIKELLSSPVRLLPRRQPRTLLYGSFLVAFLLVAFFDRRYSELTFPLAWRTSFLNSLTYLLDPLVLHLLGFILCGLLTWQYLSLSHPEERGVVRLTVSFGLPLLLLLASVALEQLVMKPAFSYPRPHQAAQPLGDPWLTTWIKGFVLFRSEDASQDVPSGFALRQLILFYFTVWIVEQRPDRPGWLSKTQRGIVYAVNTLAVGFVMFSRVYRANHTFFAMTVAIAVALFLFWAYLALMYSLSKDRERHRPLVTEAIASYVALLVVFFAYSNHAGGLLRFSVVFLVVLATAYLIPNPHPKQ